MSSISTNTSNGSLKELLTGKDCWSYNIKIGPLSREEADDINTFKGQLNNGVATTAGITTTVLTRNGKAGTAVGTAVAATLTALSKNLHQGDSILQHVKVCPSKISDSGITTETSTKIIKKPK